MNILETVVLADNEATTNEGQTSESVQQDADSQIPPQAQQNGVMGMIVTFFPFILIIALLYFMMIRPQRKREKETREMINAMKVGDKIVTIGGIVGKVSKIKDEFVWIETGNVGTQDEKSVIKFERDAIRTVDAKK